MTREMGVSGELEGSWNRYQDVLSVVKLCKKDHI